MRCGLMGDFRGHVKVQVVRLRVQQGAENLRFPCWTFSGVPQYGPILITDILRDDLPGVLEL